MKITFGNYSLDIASCVNKNSNKHQPGGVCLIFRDKAELSSKTIIKDEMGRWMASEVRIKTRLQ